MRMGVVRRKALAFAAGDDCIAGRTNGLTPKRNVLIDCMTGSSFQNLYHGLAILMGVHAFALQKVCQMVRLHGAPFF